MPAISMFYGIIVSMYFFDNNRHHRPHIHIRYQDEEEELMAKRNLAIQGQPIFQIDPLK